MTWHPHDSRKVYIDLGICHICSSEVRSDARFCGQCGSPLDELIELSLETKNLDDSLRKALRSKLIIIRELGRTSMSRVYEAQELGLNRLVALKVLAPDLATDQEMVSRFKREARTAASLNHPNIVPIHAIGSEGDVHYYTMALLSGGSLAKRIKQKLPIFEIVHIIKTIASALDHAHKHGVIHRDVKPQNILFDEYGTPILVDFGIAKALFQTQLTAAAIYLGTPHFSSPEQARGESVDARSDLYSLGIIFYLLATGQLPFDADDPLSIIYQHVNENAKSPSLISSVIPAEISHVITKLIRKDPNERFQTSTELIAVLDQFESKTKESPERELLPPAPTESILDDQLVKLEEPSEHRQDRKHNRLAYAFLVFCVLAFMWLMRSPDEPIPKLEPEVQPVVEEFEPSNLNPAVQREEVVPMPEINLSENYSAVALAPTTIVVREDKDPDVIYWGGLDPSLVQRIEAALNQHRFVRIPAGSFKMGSRTQFLDDTWAVHDVQLSDFELCVTETTQSLWQAVMGENHSCNKDSNHPVEQVSWLQVQEFLTCLNETGLGSYRLPTEAEWEYSARAGEKSYADILSGGQSIKSEAWYKKNAGNQSHQVGAMKPNDWGLYDMRGNVWEWCSDYYSATYYEASPFRNPGGPEQGTYRVIRGGSWASESNACRPVNRAFRNPRESSCEIGFRLVRVD